MVKEKLGKTTEESQAVAGQKLRPLRDTLVLTLWPMPPREICGGSCEGLWSTASFPDQASPPLDIQDRHAAHPPTGTLEHRAMGLQHSKPPWLFQGSKEKYLAELSHSQLIMKINMKYNSPSVTLTASGFSRAFSETGALSSSQPFAVNERQTALVSLLSRAQPQQTDFPVSPGQTIQCEALGDLWI